MRNKCPLRVAQRQTEVLLLVVQYKFFLDSRDSVTSLESSRPRHFCNPYVYTDDNSRYLGQEYEKNRHFAQLAGDAMGQYAQKSQEQWRKGDKKAAKELSLLKEEKRKEMEHYNRQAVAVVLRPQMLPSDGTKFRSNKLDLHGLYVKEAEGVVEQFLREFSKEQNTRWHELERKEVMIVVGEGQHSDFNKAKLRPAIKRLLTRKGYNFHEDVMFSPRGATKNYGALVVSV
ncbi:unnamed protein product [Amoebophrya sp. A120]|nr:unnamed protein product [Amoebophrya sp. A120]|eukprot:GSA120T00009204001.1